MEDQPVIADSARRHGIADEDILHSFRNPVASEDLDEGFTMLIGPDHAGNSSRSVSWKPMTVSSSFMP